MTNSHKNSSIETLIPSILLSLNFSETSNIAIIDVLAIGFNPKTDKKKGNKYDDLNIKMTKKVVYPMSNWVYIRS